jgi:hypothetical protein
MAQIQVCQLLYFVTSLSHRRISISAANANETWQSVQTLLALCIAVTIVPTGCKSIIQQVRKNARNTNFHESSTRNISKGYEQILQIFGSFEDQVTLLNE